MILDIDERWQDVIIVSWVLLICAYLYGVNRKDSSSTETQKSTVEEVFQAEHKKFHEDTVQLKIDIQKTLADFEKEIAKTVER